MVIVPQSNAESDFRACKEGLDLRPGYNPEGQVLLPHFGEA